MDVIILLGRNTSMRCQTNINATITWLKDGDSIDMLEEFGERIQLNENELMINSVGLNDSGIYTCLAVEDSSGCIKLAEAEIRVYQQENLTDCKTFSIS